MLVLRRLTTAQRSWHKMKKSWRGSLPEKMKAYDKNGSKKQAINIKGGGQGKTTVLKKHFLSFTPHPFTHSTKNMLRYFV